MLYILEVGAFKVETAGLEGFEERFNCLYNFFEDWDFAHTPFQPSLPKLSILSRIGVPSYLNTP